MIESLRTEIEKASPDDKQIIYGLLCTYYNGEIFEELEIDDVKSEVYIPLEQRPSGIFEALEILMPMENDINDESDCTALIMSVCNLDYYMTEYLIEHGANPLYWYGREDDIKLYESTGIPMNNFYLEDIDIRLMDTSNWSQKIVSDCIFKLTKIILECDGVESFFGICLSADKEN